MNSSSIVIRFLPLDLFPCSLSSITFLRSPSPLIIWPNQLFFLLEIVSTRLRFSSTDCNTFSFFFYTITLKYLVKLKKVILPNYHVIAMCIITGYVYVGLRQQYVQNTNKVSSSLHFSVPKMPAAFPRCIATLSRCHKKGSIRGSWLMTNIRRPSSWKNAVASTPTGPSVLMAIGTN